MRLEELVKEQALKEKELQLKFDLERFKIESGFRIQVKSGGLSAKICPTPEKSDSTWKDFTFEITNYLDEWLIGLEINTFQDLKDLMVVDQLKKRANAIMKDHFLDNWVNLKSANQIAEIFDNYEDVRKVNSKPMDRLGASVPESTRERTFEKRVIQRCYHCNMPGHIKAGCPKLIKNKATETLNNIEGNENPDFLNSYTTKGSVNGHEIDILRDTGATIDLVCAKYINPSSFSEDEILIPALQEYVPELALLRVTRENLINAQKKIARRLNPYTNRQPVMQVTNQVYSLEKELLVKNREDKLGNVVKLIVVPEGLRDPIKSLCHEGTSAHLGITKSKDKLNRYFYWPNCYRDMEQFVKTCDQCQKAGKPNDKKKAPLKLVPVIQEVLLS
ncbi:retrovirus-related Pol polyprotein from transposon 17.6 [Trichonephila clavipes]|nr:retrovirus-related Pol polyprotein from transposon 17.6 [Trichonephila clavipes]